MTTASSSSSPALAIEASDLRKTYPAGRGKEPVRALDGLSIAVESGTIFGLLGPNGAGKSTTVKILSTLSRADSGLARVAGIDVARHPAEVRRVIGLVAQHSVAVPIDTGLENLVLAGRLHGLSGREAKARATDLLDRFALTGAGKRLRQTYSGGMARKLDLAIGLMHQPSVLFLDEPTTGLDPQARVELWQEIGRMTRDERMTVLLTTHYLDEADHLASQLAIVDHGRVVVTGSPDELKRELRGDSLVIELAADTGARSREVLAADGALRDVDLRGTTLRARADNGAATLPDALSALEDAGIAVSSASVARPSLDDVYLHYTGETFASALSGSAAEKGVAA